MDELIRDCPYLGMAHDPQTKTSFPSTKNCCHQAKPAEVVDPSYQEDFCLTSKFRTCPVFKKNKKEPLPREMRDSSRQVSKKKKIRWLIVFIVMLVILILVLLIRNIYQRYPLVLPITGGLPPNATENIPGFTQSPTTIPSTTASYGMSAFNSSSTFTQTALDSSILSTSPVLAITGTKIPIQITASTLTPAPSSNFTPAVTLKPTQTLTRTPIAEQPPRVLDTIIGKDFPFIIHRVQTGESLSQYANQYKTNLDAILRVNYRLTVPVWAGTLVIIPVGFTDVSQMPFFQPFHVTNGGMTFEDLATQEGVKLNDLIYYNGFTSGDRMNMGDWILIPHSNSTN